MTSSVPPAPATEDEIVDCAAFFTRRGKAARIFESKTRFDGKRREKPAEAKRYEGFRQVHDI